MRRRFLFYDTKMDGKDDPFDPCAESMEYGMVGLSILGQNRPKKLFWATLVIHSNIVKGTSPRTLNPLRSLSPKACRERRANVDHICIRRKSSRKVLSKDWLKISFGVDPFCGAAAGCKFFLSTTDLPVFRKTFPSPQSSTDSAKSAEKPAPIAFTRFRMKRAADAPAKSEFVSKLAELDADLKKAPAPARFKPRL